MARTHKQTPRHSWRKEDKIHRKGHWRAHCRAVNAALQAGHDAPQAPKGTEGYLTY